MNIYRIDLESVDGVKLGAVTDILGPCLYRSAVRADDIAHEVAVSRQCFATVTRISGGGNMRAIRRFDPAGKRSNVHNSDDMRYHL